MLYYTILYYPILSLPPAARQQAAVNLFPAGTAAAVMGLTGWSVACWWELFSSTLSMILKTWRLPLWDPGWAFCWSSGPRGHLLGHLGLQTWILSIPEPCGFLLSTLFDSECAVRQPVLAVFCFARTLPSRRSRLPHPFFPPIFYLFAPGWVFNIAHMRYLSSMGDFGAIWVPIASDINSLCSYGWAGFQNCAPAVLEQHGPFQNYLGSACHIFRIINIIPILLLVPSVPSIPHISILSPPSWFSLLFYFRYFPYHSNCPYHTYYSYYLYCPYQS